MIYEPREDSFMLEKWVKMLAHGKVLDVGTGSGIQAIAAVDKSDSVLAIDIDEEALKQLDEKKIEKISTKKSNLFQGILEKFDVIIFNPPYLPQDEGIEDNTIYGGKEGYEVLVKFLEQAKYHLNDEGFILMLFSSFTNKKIIDDNLDKLEYTWLVLDEKKIEMSMQELEYTAKLLARSGKGYETLYVYKAWNT